MKNPIELTQNQPRASDKHPPILSLAIIISAFERFGFYILADSLILFLEKFYGFADHEANLFYSTLNALTYSAPAIGGYLADNVFGIRRSIIFGLILEGVGLLCLIFPTKLFLYLGISLVITGVGFFKTAPTNLMARAYETKDRHIDNGYTLFYMAMNIGSATSAILAGFLQRYYGWHIIFLVASIGTYLGLVFYFIFKSRAKMFDVIAGKNKLEVSTWITAIISVLIAVVIFAFLMSETTFAQVVFYLIAVVVIAYLIYEIHHSPKEEKKRIIACLLLILIGMIFFMMYFQRYTSVLLFMDRAVVHTVLGITIPSIAMLALNPLWIICLSPILIYIYNAFSKKEKSIAITTKFPIGMLMVSLSFLLLRFSIYFADANHKISFIWMVMVFGLYSLGELLVSALGVAMIARIAPKRLYGTMMGAWFLIATSIGSVLGGIAANFAAIPKDLIDPIAILHVYGNTFLAIGVCGLVITLLAFAAAPYIKRIAKL